MLPNLPKGYLGAPWGLTMLPRLYKNYLGYLKVIKGLLKLIFLKAI
jgi:hypothetical protein